MPQMFNALFPRAQPFEEPSPLLFKNIQLGECVVCDWPCTWISYAWGGRPRPICSVECFEKADEVFHWKPKDSE